MGVLLFRCESCKNSWEEVIEGNAHKHPKCPFCNHNRQVRPVARKQRVGRTKREYDDEY